MKQILSILAIVAIAIASCKKKNPGPPPTAPLVTTAALSNVNIGAGSATAGGSIVSDGGAIVTKSGIVWSPSNNTPTLTADSIVSGATANGTFANTITGLDFNKTYYFRAFATNSAGTGYGSVVTLTTSSDSVRFTYNGQTVTYGIITSPTTGKKWLDRNLGAKRVATSRNDYQAYGDLFQWGRPDDGHQLVNWSSSTEGTWVNGTTSTKAATDNPGHSNFYIVTDINNDPDFDWRSGNNRNRWNTIPQGPCPVGWHVPSLSEWAAEVSKIRTGGTATSGGIIDIADAYSNLKLNLNGYTNCYDDPGNWAAHQIFRAGLVGWYWASDDKLSGSVSLGRIAQFDGGGAQVVRESAKADAFPVRCIKD